MYGWVWQTYMLRSALRKYYGCVAVGQICLWGMSNQVLQYDSSTNECSHLPPHHTVAFAVAQFAENLITVFLSVCHIVPESIMHRLCGAWPMRVQISALRQTTSIKGC